MNEKVEIMINKGGTAKDDQINDISNRYLFNLSVQSLDVEFLWKSKYNLMFLILSYSGE